MCMYVVIERHISSILSTCIYWMCNLVKHRPNKSICAYLHCNWAISKWSDDCRPYDSQSKFKAGNHTSVSNAINFKRGNIIIAHLHKHAQVCAHYIYNKRTYVHTRMGTKLDRSRQSKWLVFAAKVDFETRNVASKCENRVSVAFRVSFRLFYNPFPPNCRFCSTIIAVIMSPFLIDYELNLFPSIRSICLRVAFFFLLFFELTFPTIGRFTNVSVFNELL